MDIGGHMEARRHNILRATISNVGPAASPMTGAPDQDESSGGLTTTGGDGQDVH